ncbi:beta-glucosidase [Streptomyces pristinaespiralis]|uniref:Exo-alpha-(1->6)-L-arabinopyranosidase n=2 Tax=Streptomyces pristinaespiralis TaxID=38300 RepID=B5H6S2_STRE2|nr:glycoside hydrolase family 3 N-terminal domain-containing protein [Streptomyces pristinaespiralis]EDY62533.1 glycoside hydrolase family 3 protein [Streptomyces pristinaespiralis ATCC 25486]
MGTDWERAGELLREMTLEEKAMQLASVVPLALLGPRGPLRGQLDQLLGHGIGHVAGIGLLGHKLPEEIARSVNAIQRYLVTETRLKIPAIFHNEALNGLVAPGFTAFPTPIALAATWDTEAVRQMADVMRRQMRAVGMLQALAPVIDVARDARWGRMTETYGEDPYLVAALGVAFTRGMQGNDLREGVIACAKHFIGYAQTEAGQNMASVAVGPRELYDVYGRPFEAAIRVAGLAGVMATYSEFEGEPVHTSRAVLTDLLRDRMGFSGTVLSDYNGIGWAQTRQHVATSEEEVGAMGVAAGMDVEAPSPYGYGKTLVRAVENGLLPLEQLDVSVRRVLRDKFALGLFDKPYVAEDPVEIRSRAGEGDELSRRLSDAAVTLLKNDAGLLPLDRSLQRVAVIGPHADSVMVGFPQYSYPAGVAMIRVAAELGFFPMPGVGELPKEGFASLTTELERAQGDLEIYARANYPAVSLAEAVRRLLPEAEVTAVAGAGVLPSQPTDIPAAVAAAVEADLVILYIGGKAGWYGDDLTEKEGGDTANIDLPEQQVELVNAVLDAGKPTVAVVAMARPQSLAPVIDRLPAVLTCYYGGPHQGAALADALFGITNPSGKLPVTIPRHVGQVPIHHGQRWGSGYRRTEADIHKGYLDMPSTPLYPFGHGLSYTTFDYGPLRLDTDDVDTGGEIHLSVSVTNTGDRAGTEIVQLYAADTAIGVTLPAQQLAGFARVELGPGQSKKVEFVLPLSVLAYTGAEGEVVMEPGPIEFSVGSSSDDIRSRARVAVTGRSCVVAAEQRSWFSAATVTD